MFLLFIMGILARTSSTQAQQNGDLQDMQKSTSAHTTPRGVAVVAQLHIAHPETTHPLKYRGYYIYRKELGSYKSEQEVLNAYTKLTGKKPSGDEEKDIREFFDLTPYKRLNKVPIAAPTNPKDLVEALGIDLYQRLSEDVEQKKEGSLMEKIRAGDSNLALYGGMFNPKIGEALGMIYYDTEVEKGKTYYYVATKVREDFSEGDTTVMGGVTYGELDNPIQKPFLKALSLKERASTDTSHIAESRKKEKAKSETKKTENLKGLANMADTSAIAKSITQIKDSVYNKIVKLDARPAALGNLHHFLRGTDSLGVFTPITSMPAYAYADSTGAIQPFAVQDTAVVNTMTYYYTVAAEDIWGNRVYSDTLKITITPPLPPIPQELAAETTREGVNLTWEALDYEYLSGFNLYKKINEEPDTIIGEKINSQLIPANITTFTETKVKPGATYYYFLVAVDKFGQESKYSAMARIIFENKRPPLPPMGLKAVANPETKTIVISWDAGTEADLAGYSVYRAQNTKEEPMLITKELLDPTATSYIDTTRIGKNVDYYYYARSMNLTGYESPLSQYALSRMQEKIKPERVNSLSGVADILQGNQLTWDSPLDANVELVRLFRMTAPDFTKRTLLYEERVSNGKFIFRDKNIEAGVQYIYLLRGVSADSLESDDSAPATLFLSPEKLQAPDRLSIAPQADGSLLLKWVPNFQEGLAGFHVYRISYKGGKKRLTTTPVLKGTNTYLDKDIQKDEIYYYFLKSVDAKGFEGLDSEQVKFEMIVAEK